MTDRILIIDHEADEHVALLAAVFPNVAFEAAATLDEGRRQIADATALMAFSSGLDDALIADARRLEWLHFLSSGTDALTCLPSLNHDVVVTSTHGIHSTPVSEMALFHMLCLARDVPRLMRNKANAGWDRFSQPLLEGKVVVILGTGVTALALATRCTALGMTVVGVSATPRPLEGFERVLPRAGLGEAAALADFLVLLTPLNEATKSVINDRILAAMKPSAFLINLGRGGLCDEDALLAALGEKRIAGAGLDTFWTEPLPTDHPLWQADNVFITPHMGGASDSYPRLAHRVLRGNVACFLERRWDDMVNRIAR